MTDSTRRFSSRVENYTRYRPRYPVAILDTLKSRCGLTRNSVIADIGSGTGFLAELFLGNENQVSGVEPNPEMRAAGERLLQTFSNFTSVASTAESTTLAAASVDFITAGQAFHWFDHERSRAEFKRILRPNGWVVLVWNDRRTDCSPFLAEYERLLHKYGTDYAKVDHKQIDACVLRKFFGKDPVREGFLNHQHFDLPSLRGRLLSSSYVPDEGEPRSDEMLESLEDLFTRRQVKDRVTFEYDTLLYFGQLL